MATALFIKARLFQTKCFHRRGSGSRGKPMKDLLGTCCTRFSALERGKSMPKETLLPCPGASFSVGFMDFLPSYRPGEDRPAGARSRLSLQFVALGSLPRCGATTSS